MTAVLVVASFTAGMAAGSAGAYRILAVAYDLHGYRKIRLADTRVRDLCADADHHYRDARRAKRDLYLAREQIGDLVLELGNYRFRRPRRNPIPRYGANR